MYEDIIRQLEDYRERYFGMVIFNIGKSAELELRFIEDEITMWKEFAGELD